MLLAGADEKLTYDLLREVACKISSDRYWQNRRAEQRVKTESHKEIGHETVADSSSQVEEAIANLKAENEELKLQLAALQKKYEYEADCAKRYYPNHRKFPGIESERNYFKGETQKLRAELESLKSQPPMADLIKQYETDYETIKQSLPKPTVTRDWVHFWRFKTWLESQVDK